jgi:hypothetical protein
MARCKPNATTDNTPIAIAVGTGLPRPPSPASGARKAPNRNGSAPWNADAVPAMAPWSAMASAVPLGRIMPKAATNTNSGTSSATSGGRAVSAATSRAAAAATITMSGTATSVSTLRFFTRRVPSWAISTRPIALIMKNRLNSCGLFP